VSAFVLVVTGALGLVIGSFLNVVIYRVPRGESIVRPRSHCPQCDQPIRPRDEIPVVSWLLLKGRCRDCGVRISPRYPSVELGTAALFVVMGVKFGATLQLPAYLYFAAIAVALSMIDIDVKRLPDVITLPSYVVAGLLLLVPAAAHDTWTDYGRAWLAALILFAFYAIVWFVYPAGMGLGDVKLAGVLGLYLGWLGWGVLAVGAFLGFLLGALGGVLLMLSRRGGRKSKVPFGPYMVAGATLSILWGAPIWNAYLSTIR
jgi:leader peptidase (prepilin peptidase)/N-methyltransferase